MLRLMIFLILMMIGVPLSLARASVAQEQLQLVFAAANRAYREKDLSRAEQLYRDLVTSGVANAALYYNLGTTLGQIGKVGEAVLYLEKARRLAPRDPDIGANLALLAPPGNWQPPFVLAVPFITIRDALSQGEWRWLFVAIHCSVMAVGAWLALRRRRVPLALTATLLSLYMLVLGFAAWSYYQSEIRRVIVVTAEEAEVYSGPSPRFNRVMTAQEGLLLRTLPYPDREWYRVVLPMGQIGFVSSSKAVQL